MRWRERCLAICFLMCMLTACTTQPDVKIGVSFGVGSAVRWIFEQADMKQRAVELDVELLTRYTTEGLEQQKRDCRELIDKGVNVLIIIARDVNNMDDIIAYAKSKNVKIISYARLINARDIDLFIGHDCLHIGNDLGKYLALHRPQGKYIILRGDPDDNNATLIYEGAMPPLLALGDSIQIIMDASVPNWSPDAAKKLVRQALADNANSVDAILAPNDALAGAAREVLSERGITTPVAITGTDADLKALKRIVNDTQSMTLYMNLDAMARASIDEAYHLATGTPPYANGTVHNDENRHIPAMLIAGTVITKDTIRQKLVETEIIAPDILYGH